LFWIAGSLFRPAVLSGEEKIIHCTWWKMPGQQRLM